MKIQAMINEKFEIKKNVIGCFQTDVSRFQNKKKLKRLCNDNLGNKIAKVNLYKGKLET